MSSYVSEQEKWEAFKKQKRTGTESKQQGNTGNNASSEQEKWEAFKKQNRTGINDSFVSAFLTDSQKFVQDSQSRYDNLSWSTGVNNTWTNDSADLRNRSARIRAYLRTSSNPYDEKVTADLNSYLDSFDESLKGFGNAFHDASQIYSQYASQEAYDRAAPDSRDKRQQKYASNQQRIAEMERVQEQFKALDMWYNAYRSDKDNENVTDPNISGMLAQYNALNEKYGSYDDMVKELAALGTENRLYERGEGGYVSKDEDDMYTLTQRDDFAQMSALRDFGNPTLEEYDKWYTAQYGGQQIDPVTGKVVMISAPTRYEDAGVAPQIKDKLGFYLQMVNDDYTMSAASAGSDYYQLMADAERGSWKYLTEDEISSYYYLLNTQGESGAMRYLDSLQTELNRRQTLADNSRYVELYERAGFMGKIGMNAATVPAQVLGGVTGFLDDVTHAVQGKEMNPYSPAHSDMHYSQTVRGTTAQKIDEAVPWARIPVVDFSAGDLYQTGMSGLDSLAVSRFGKLGGVLLGAGAAASEAMRLYQEGATQEQIMTQSVLAGAAEMVFENIGIDNLLKIKDVDTVKGMIVNVLKQGTTEALEEGGTEIANILTDTIVRKSESDWAKLVAANGGDTWKAFLSEVQTVAQSSLGGFFSGVGTGGLSAGTSYTGNRILQESAYRDTGRQLIRDGGVDQLKQLANEMYGVTEGKAQRQLGRQTAKVEKNATPARVGRLYSMVQENLPTYQKAKAEQTRTALVNSMTEKGVDPQQAESVAGAIAAAQAGDELTQDQMTTLLSLGDTDPKVIEAIEEVGEQLLQSAEQDTFDYDPSETLEPAEIPSAEGKVLYKNNPVELADVAQAGDGKMVMTLEDGSTVDVSELSFPDQGEQELYTAIARYAQDTEAAKRLLKSYRDGSASAQVFARGMEEAYYFGRMQYTPQQIMQDGVFAKQLSSSQISLAYAQGKAFMEKLVTQHRQEASKKKTGKPREGSVNYGYKGEKVDKSRLNEAQKVVVDFAERLADKKGMTFYFYRSHINAQGQRVYKNPCRAGSPCRQRLL